jgi:hypothetical protein
MDIDFQPDDTFRITHIARLAQFRGNKCRFVSEREWVSNDEVITKHFKVISREFARDIIHAAGHTIIEATPAPTHVPWPTNVVVGEITGIIFRMGTKEQCERWIREHSLGSDNHEVRPLAPAPLTPAMVTLLKSFDGYFRQQPTIAAERINIAICALLNEGGAA